MTTAEFLSHLHTLDVKLWAEADGLRCNAPEGVLTPAIQEELQNRKEEILLLLKSAQGKGLPNRSPIRTVAREGNLRLSFAQERLWFLCQLFPENPAYNVAFSTRLAGLLDVLALQKSLQALVDRHESLRTCFRADDGKPIQVILDDCRVPFSEHDLKDLPEAERESSADKLIEEEILRPFDLTHGPVIRTALLKMADQDHILLITIHHIAVDGWSFGVIRRELAALYNAFVDGQPSPLSPLAIQYADFADWQRQWLTGDVLDEQLIYWRKQLAGLSNLALPTDRPRPPVQSHKGACHSFRLSESLTRELKALSRKAGVTLATTLLAAFQALLARYAGQTDVAVGSPIANRTRVELESLVGFFVNTLVMRTDLSGDPTFREMLARANEVALGAYEHQDLPFEQLVADLQPERDFSRNPLFQVLFAFQNVPRGAAALQGLTFGTVGLEHRTTRMDLECFVWDEEVALKVTLVFNTDLFDRATIERFGAHYRRVLAKAVSDPARRLSEIPLLGESERQQLLVDWNSTRVEVPQLCIHELVESQVARTPTATAVQFEDQTLTYQDLNTRANQLAHYLRGLGIVPGALVGIFMARSHDVAVGILGVLKAGGAYVPLDPAYPSERLAYMVADSGVKVLLTQDSLVESLPPHRAQVVCVDTDWGTIAQSPSHTPVSETTAEHVAVVIYTSGSTGRPKGVALCHRTMTNLIEWQARVQRSRSDSTTLQFASLGFDVSFQEIFSTLATGGRLLMIPESTRANFRQLLDVLDRQGVHRIFLPFVALQQLANSAVEHGRFLPQLQEVITAGEQLKVSESIARFMSHRPDGILVNQYGPSESHVVSSYELSGPPEGWPTLPPIGRPIDSTQLYVLDARLEPVPIGAIGELYIGGTGLARGYLNRPEMTAEKFVPHPFSADPGVRLYKTGDQARYRQDGNLEFLGRRDHQVKLRGYRIELGEIDAVLSEHPAVHEAVALVREETPGDQRLVAYVVSPQGATPSEFRQHLKRALPEHMVPAHFMTLDVLPLTPSGKVDRRALPVPEGGQPQVETEFAAPQTPTEKQLGEIWQEVLGLERVGVHDNFFELGGHSLLATQVLSRACDRFGMELPLARLFETPTIAGLTELIETIRLVDRKTRSQLSAPASGREAGKL